MTAKNEYKDYGSNIRVYVGGAEEFIDVNWDDICPDDSAGETSINYTLEDYLDEWVGFQDYSKSSAAKVRDALESAWGQRIKDCLAVEFYRIVDEAAFLSEYKKFSKFDPIDEKGVISLAQERLDNSGTGEFELGGGYTKSGHPEMISAGIESVKA